MPGDGDGGGGLTLHSVPAGLRVLTSDRLTAVCITANRHRIYIGQFRWSFSSRPPSLLLADAHEDFPTYHKCLNAEEGLMKLRSFNVLYLTLKADLWKFHSVKSLSQTAHTG